MEAPLGEKQQDLEETLLSVRAEFVERVSEEVLKLLLDSLEADGVLNNSETEAILQKNQTRADKARSTIDAVRKKGPHSCKMMIQHLQLKDATLSNQLGLSFAFSAQPDPNEVPPSVKVQSESFTLKENFLTILEELSKEEFKKFKWRLMQLPNKCLTKEQEETFAREDVVDRLVQHHGSEEAVRVMKTTLQKMGRNDLVNQL